MAFVALAPRVLVWFVIGVAIGGAAAPRRPAARLVAHELASVEAIQTYRWCASSDRAGRGPTLGTDWSAEVVEDGLGRRAILHAADVTIVTVLDGDDARTHVLDGLARPRMVDHFVWHPIVDLDASREGFAVAGHDAADPARLRAWTTRDGGRTWQAHDLGVATGDLCWIDLDRDGVLRWRAGAVTQSRRVTGV